MKKSENLLIDLMETYAFPPSPATAREAPPGEGAAESSHKSLYCATPRLFNAKVRAVLPPRGARFKDDHLHTCMYIERSKNANIVAYTPKYKEVTDEGTRLTQKQTEDVKRQHTMSEEEIKKLYEKLKSEMKVADGKVAPSPQEGADAVSSPGSAMSPTLHQKLVPDIKDPMHCYWIKLEPEHVERRRSRGETEDVCELNFLENKMAYGCSVQPLISRSNSPTHAATAKSKPSAATKPLSQARSDSHMSSKCQTFVKELTKQLVDKYKKVKPADKTQKERYTKLSAAEEAAAREWCRYFQPSYAKYVALASWNIVLLHLPPLTTFEDASAMEEMVVAQKKTAAATATHADPAASTPAATKPATTTIIKKRNAAEGGTDKGNNGKETAKAKETDAAAKKKAAAEEDKERKSKESRQKEEDEAVAQVAALSAETIPVMLAYVDHKLSIVKKVFVASVEPKHFYQLPSVEYIEAFGTCLETGAPTYERLGKGKKDK